jgi:hypothetical protein
MLLWLYIVVRIVINEVNVHTPFIDSIRFISIWEMGAFAFGLGFLSMFLYLALWGKFDCDNMKPR